MGMPASTSTSEPCTLHRDKSQALAEMSSIVVYAGFPCVFVASLCCLHTRKGPLAIMDHGLGRSKGISQPGHVTGGLRSST